MHTHLEGSSNKKMMLQTQRGHNDYDKEEDLLKTYLKEKDEGMKGEFHGDQHVAFNSKVMISKHEKMHLSEHFSNFSIFFEFALQFFWSPIQRPCKTI